MTEQELKEAIEEALMVLADGSRWGSSVEPELDKIMKAVQDFNNGKGGAPEGFPPPDPDAWVVRRTTYSGRQEYRTLDEATAGLPGRDAPCEVDALRWCLLEARGAEAPLPRPNPDEWMVRLDKAGRWYYRSPSGRKGIKQTGESALRAWHTHRCPCDRGDGWRNPACRTHGDEAAVRYRIADSYRSI